MTYAAKRVRGVKSSDKMGPVGVKRRSGPWGRQPKPSPILGTTWCHVQREATVFALIAAAVAFPVTIAATFVFSRIYPARPKVSGSTARWITQCVIATAASCAALLL